MHIWSYFGFSYISDRVTFLLAQTSVAKSEVHCMRKYHAISVNHSNCIVIIV